MANDLQNVADILVDEAAILLRNNSIAARLVSRDLETAASQKNKRVDVPVFPALTAVAVTPGTPSSAQDIAPTVVPVTLDQWYEVPFVLTDREMAEVAEARVLPRASERAVEALADNIDSFILGRMYKRSFGFRVKASPAVVQDVTQLSKLLNDEKIAKDSRRTLLLDTSVTEEFERLPSFHEAEKVGDDGSAMREGSLGRKFGFGIFMDQNMPAHTAGSITGAPAVVGVHAIGDKTIAVDTGVGEAINFNEGDIIAFSGHTQTYVVTADLTVGASAAGVLNIYPGLRSALADNETFDIASGFVSHTASLAFHEMAFAFATRPLQTLPTPGSIVSQTTDPISGLSLRLELTREHKQDRWSFDVLYGGEVIYPEAIARLIRA